LIVHFVQVSSGSYFFIPPFCAPKNVKMDLKNWNYHILCTIAFSRIYSNGQSVSLSLPDRNTPGNYCFNTWQTSRNREVDRWAGCWSSVYISSILVSPLICQASHANEQHKQYELYIWQNVSVFLLYLYFWYFGSIVFNMHSDGEYSLM
jgi:hypothetical protein